MKKRKTHTEDLLLMDMDLIAFRELNDLDYEDED